MELIAQAISAEGNPAGGAAIWEAVLGTGVAVLMTLALIALGWAHRTGRVSWLGNAAEALSTRTGLPGWAALPSAITGVSLVVALIGMYWDISLHIADGRDAGPFANPAHFFILFGLFGVFIAGFCAVVLPKGRPSKAAVRISDDWYAPLGGIGLIFASGFALLGFPLDDFWHRIFGQDVTLWGPTHLMMIGGAALAFVGQVTLLGEAKLSEREPDRSTRARAVGADLFNRMRVPMLMGGFLIGMSTFQAEFDFGVPQFRMLFEPVLIAVAAGVALTAARIYGGRGMAIYAVLFFIAMRGGLALLVGPILGEPTPHFPLYIAEALLVEAAALMIAPRARPYAFATLAGVLIGTVGFAAEYGWSHLWMPIEWQPVLVSEALIPATIAAVAASLVGAYMGCAWRSPLAGSGEARVPRPAVAVAGLLAVVAIFGYGLRTEPVRGVEAFVSLEEVSPAPDRTVEATVRIDPPAAAEDASWLNATAWQGKGLHVDQLEAVDADAGVYKTTEPLPVSGNWKSLIRLQKGDSITGLPIFLPEDTAIPAPGIAARPEFQREFVADSEILQREQLDGVPGWTKLAGYAMVGGIVATIIALLGWILSRLAAKSSGAAPARGGRSKAGLPGVGRPAGSSS